MLDSLTGDHHNAVRASGVKYVKFMVAKERYLIPKVVQLALLPFGTPMENP
jgi:hypothetical protein